MAAIGRLTAHNLGLGVVAYDPNRHYDQTKNRFFGLIHAWTAAKAVGDNIASEFWTRKRRKKRWALLRKRRSRLARRACRRILKFFRFESELPRP